MRASAYSLLLGLFRGASHCPSCGSIEIRPSREPYEGPWARWLRLVPFRCRACFRHFPVRSSRAVAWDPEASAIAWRRRPNCPQCGSANAAESQRATPPFWDRLIARETYRCMDCHARFRKIDRRKLLATFLFAVAMGSALFLGYSLTSSRRARRPASRGRTG